MKIHVFSIILFLALLGVLYLTNPDTEACRAHYTEQETTEETTDGIMGWLAGIGNKAETLIIHRQNCQFFSCFDIPGQDKYVIGFAGSCFIEVSEEFWDVTEEIRDFLEVDE